MSVARSASGAPDHPRPLSDHIPYPITTHLIDHPLAHQSSRSALPGTGGVSSDLSIATTTTTLLLRTPPPAQYHYVKRAISAENINRNPSSPLAPVSPSFPPPNVKKPSTRPLPPGTPTYDLSPGPGTPLNLGPSVVTPVSSSMLATAVARNRSRKLSLSPNSPKMDSGFVTDEAQARQALGSSSSPASSSSELFQSARLKLHQVDAEAISKAREMFSGSSPHLDYGASPNSPSPAPVTRSPRTKEMTLQLNQMVGLGISDPERRPKTSRNTSFLQLSLNPSPIGSPVSTVPPNLTGTAAGNQLQGSFFPEMSAHSDAGAAAAGPSSLLPAISPSNPSSLQASTSPNHNSGLQRSTSQRKSTLSHEFHPSSSTTPDESPVPSSAVSPDLIRSPPRLQRAQSDFGSSPPRDAIAAGSEADGWKGKGKEVLASPPAESTAGKAGPRRMSESMKSQSMKGATRMSRSGSAGTGSALLREIASVPKSNADYVIAVVGAPNVGKSTVIKKAFKSWGLTQPVVLGEEHGHRKVSSYTASVETGHTPRLRSVEILEIDIHVLYTPVQGGEEGYFAWPKYLPRIDGVMVCYDAMNRSSVNGVDRVLRILCQDLPTIIVACKSDPAITPALQPSEGNEIGSPLGIGLVEVSIMFGIGKQKMKMSFSWMLRAISRERSGSSARGTFSTSLTKDMLGQISGERIKKQQHAATTQGSGSHASVDRPQTDARAGTPDSEASSHNRLGQEILWDPATETYVLRSPAQGSAISGDELSIKGSPPLAFSSLSKNSSSASLYPHLPSSLTAPPVPSKLSAARTITDLSSNAESLDPAASSASSTADPLSNSTILKAASSPEPADSKFISAEELYARVLNALCSGTENPFVNTFFLVYRRFCLPRTLLGLMRKRFYELRNLNILTEEHKKWSLMRLASAVSDWARSYPDDWTCIGMREILLDLHVSMSKEAYLSLQAGHLSSFIESLSQIEDVDHTWSMRDPQEPPVVDLSDNNEMEMLKIALEQSNHRTSVFSDLDDTTLEALARTDILPESKRNSGEASAASGALQQYNSRSSSSQVNVASSALETKGSPTLEETPAFKHRKGSDASKATRQSVESTVLSDELQEYRNFTKALGLLQDASDGLVAIELSKLEWELFDAVRPRDCLRHVIGHERHSPVGACIQHFNQISSWVSTMILAASKPKQRARVFERFMAIAQHLRRLNNYSSLWAVVSGINDGAVQRLGQTRLLVRSPLEKEVQNFTHLMSASMGHHAYKASLKQDIQNGLCAIPFLGAIVADLAKVHAIHQDTRESDAAIHWAKFHLMAEALGPLVIFQARSNPIVTNRSSAAVRSLILETIVLDDEGRSRRSRQLENEGGTSSGQRMLRMMTDALSSNSTGVPNTESMFG